MTFKTIAAVAALVLTSVPAHAQDGWRLVWSDEFDGDRLDETKWTYAADCGGGGNDERQCYAVDPETVSVKDGVLRLTAIKRKTRGLANPWAGPTGPMKTGDYASGKILTQGKASWLYGRVEARARVPGGQGVWPAIWMMPELSTYGGWPKSGEIDILETVNLGAPCDGCEGGRENRVFGTIHFAGDAAGTHRQVSNSTPMPVSSDGFHVYAVEWTPEAITWFVDGRRYARAEAADWKRDDQVAGPAPFDQPFHLILNLAFGGRWPEGANAKGIDEAALPATMEVDWVRVSQRP
ncbi:glycoside hydrolase family 16 protein [Caulobacter sp. RL271]|jgi:beta-glucanase (GH16 family)|uniref:Glycoside hydrolase family 16 protein n=1 Tax=Caulobacter segnis TaxID=88688 RepID=A0ABY4ZVS0_9CAUL|nr:glycoside hydrolase family 16 protein [Caulobacter segnis]USQ96459.1 glycoside hydrolase family 16 protein [Caulobacter segnis]